MVQETFVGRSYGPIEHEIEADEVQAFLDATDDETGAYEDGLEVIPPMFAVVYAREVIAEMFFDEELALDLPRLVHGGQSFTFHRPVTVGDTVTTEGHLAELTDRGDNQVVTVETTSTVDGDPVTSGEWTFVIRGGATS